MAENLRNLGVEECDFLISIHGCGQVEQPK